jgi:hypothetical protein
MTKIFLNDEMLNAIAKGKNVFEAGYAYIYFGCEIRITRRQEPYFYATPSNPKATRSRRYFGEIITPDGKRIELIKPKSGDGWRGGEIARECGLWVTKERDDQKKLGNLYEMTNRRK